MIELLRRREMMGVQGGGGSPYSDEATEILMLNFPDYWDEIRIYGVKHLDIVPFVNEDPFVICSLVDVGVYRWLVNTNTAYIKTDYDTKADSQWEMSYYISNYRGNARHGSGVSNAYFFMGNSNVRVCAGCGRNYELNIANSDTNNHLSILESGRFTYDGVSLDLGHFINSAKVWLFNMNGNTTIVRGGIKYAIFDESGTEIRHFVPFKLGEARSSDDVYPSTQGAQSVGTYGMIDIVTGMFYPNANSSGSFSEAYKDINNNSWTPTYP